MLSYSVCLIFLGWIKIVIFILKWKSWLGGCGRTVAYSVGEKQEIGDSFSGIFKYSAHIIVSVIIDGQAIAIFSVADIKQIST